MSYRNFDLAGCFARAGLETNCENRSPGPKGKRFDYLIVDDEDHYLLSVPLGPEILYVIDMRTNNLVKAIRGVPGITGLEFVPETGKVYTSDWGEEKIGIVNPHSMTVVEMIGRAGEKCA